MNDINYDCSDHPVSVIVPVYNDDKWLEDCLQSISAQDLNGLEIICVDDGSTDTSPIILKHFAEKDSRYKILSHNENRGTMAARKTGIFAATGDYIQFVDADDTIDPGLCSCVYELIREKQTEILEFSAQVIKIETGRNYCQDPLCESLPKELFPDKLILPLWHYIITRDLCVRTWRAIPDIRSIKHEDVFSCFYLAYFANSHAGVRTVPKYNYYWGRGLSTDSKITWEKWNYYCESGKYYQIISEFLQREQASEEAFSALNRMSIRRIEECYRMYTLFPETEKPKAAKLFVEGWNIDPNFSYWLLDNLEKYRNDVAEKAQIILEQKAAMDQIYESESWKVGNYLINPLHVIKTLVHK